MYMSQHQAAQQQDNYLRFNGALFSDISFGFMPAFKNSRDQQIHLSKDFDGVLSVMHLFDGLPDSWTLEKDDQGNTLTLKPEIVAGFMRNAQFYTLSDLRNCIRDS